MRFWLIMELLFANRTIVKTYRVKQGDIAEIQKNGAPRNINDSIITTHLLKQQELISIF
jgi:hypothetical protein